MKTNRHIKSSVLAFITITFIVSATMFAQPQQKPPKIPNDDQINKMIENLSTELSLNEKQHQEIHELYITHFDHVREKVELKKAEHRMEREEMDNLRSKFEEEVKSLLSEEQQTMFNKFIDKERKHHRKGRQNHN
jgi:hypothetical protein